MFKRAPFGIKHLPALFQRILERIIHGLPFCRVYIDDIVVFSDTEEEHIEHLRTVIDRLTNAGMHLGIPKCHFGVPAVRVLGHFCDGEGIRPDKDKAVEMLNFPQPRSFKDLQSFMGLANYFSCYIPRFAQVCAPINELRSPAKAAQFDWSKDWTGDLATAFKTLKELLAQCFTLSYPDWNKKFYLATDASTVGVGGVLYQKGEDNKPKYIQVMSRSLSQAERNYSATKLELTAIVYCLKRCDYYLYGRHFHLLTDHKALTYMFTKKELSPLLTRWYEHIMVHDFSVSHVEGVKNVLPDALSRLYPDYSMQKVVDMEDEPVTFMNAQLCDRWQGDFTVGDNFKLFPECFKELDARWGPHTVDLFAHPGNAQVKRFCGLAKPRKKIHSRYKYVGKPFDVMWSNENAYAFPPYNVIDAVLDKVQKEKCVITLVTPLNTKAPWFQRCIQLSLVCPVVFKYTQACMLGYGTDYRDIITAPWGNFVAWRVSADPPPMRARGGVYHVANELEKLESAAFEALEVSRLPSVPICGLMECGRAQEDDPDANESEATEVQVSRDQQKSLALLKHLEGHVGSSAMINKLKADGHAWKHMQELCQEVVRECYSCQVHEAENPEFHELEAVTASLPMDHIAIDCHTMHTPSEGYCVLLSVVDLCTRFVWLRALKDKSALTVAYALWNIFANFGFPKVMQSDNGTEFVNKVVKALVEASHIDHRLITAYHPRANGTVERSFKNIMEMGNNFCNGASADWFHSVPQVQLWLNLRATRTHGFTPFSIMFSRPFVGFKDFSKVPLSELSPELLQKRYETAFEFCYPAVEEASKKVVARRKLKFDKKRNSLIEPFPNGAYVMLKSPKRQSKQHPKYVGPYVVLRRTRGGSYVLQDETGDLFPRNAAPSQLKLISYENTRNAIAAGESVHEVERLINHRGKPGARQYKVRWAGYGPDDDTWEDASHIMTTLIHQYWEAIDHKDKESIVRDMDNHGAVAPGSDTEPDDDDDVKDEHHPFRRKRGRPPKDVKDGHHPLRRKRGRPPKVVKDVHHPLHRKRGRPPKDQDVPAPKRRRGRPPKRIPKD